VRSLPPGAGLGRLCDDETTAEAGNQRRRREARVRVPAVRGESKGGGYGSGEEFQVVRRGLNSPGTVLGVQAMRGGACTGRTRAAAAAESWLDTA
jgi:hypothetical protein